MRFKHMISVKNVIAGLERASIMTLDSIADEYCVDSFKHALPWKEKQANIFEPPEMF